MYLAHLSDFHVTEGPHLADQREVLNRIVDTQNTPDAWLITGDMYGTTVPHRSTPAERDVLYPVIKRMAEVAPVVVVQGNHDHALDLQGLRHLGGMYPVQVHTKAATVSLITAGGPLHLYILPYPTKRWLLAGQKVPKGVEATQAAVERTLRALLEMWRLRIDKIRQEDPDEHHVLCAHVQIRGSKVGSGVVLAGQEIELTAQQLIDLGVDYGALGHLHTVQEAAPNHWYAGSLWNTAHSKTQQRRSYNTVGFGADQTTIVHWATNPREFLTLDYQWGETGWIKRPSPDFAASCEVRMRLVVPAQLVAGCPWEEEIARVKRAGAHRVISEKVIEPVLRIRSPEVAKALTIEDKMTAYWEGLATTPTPEDIGAALNCFADMQVYDDDELMAATAKLLTDTHRTTNDSTTP